MDNFQRLEHLFRSGVFRHPLSDGPGFVDLVRVILRCRGGALPAESPIEHRLGASIGTPERLLFVLVDGMGERILDGLPQESFLRSHRHMTLRAVFPSTTAAALVSLATAQWPGRHGAMGWWLYLGARNLSLVTLPFVERGTGIPLEQLGMRPQDLFPLPSAWRELPGDTCAVLPHAIAGSTFSCYARGNARPIAYTDIEQGVSVAAEHALASEGLSFTYLYLPQLDAAMHHFGPGAVESRALLAQIDRRLEDMVARVRGKVRVVITADHGHVEIPPGKQHCLAPDDALLELLTTFPSGEPRVPFFHVRKGVEEVFEKRFTERFGDDFLLVRAAQIEQAGLLGPRPVCETARARLGTHVGIPLGASALAADAQAPSTAHLGAHGGLLPEEMEIPLLVA